MHIRLIVMLVVLVLAGCAAPAAPSREAPRTEGAVVARQTPKVARLAIRIEPVGFIGSMVATTTSTGGVLGVTEIAHNWLTRMDASSLPGPSPWGRASFYRAWHLEGQLRRHHGDAMEAPAERALA